MTQYVLEIRDSDGWLACCFTVTTTSPIPAEPSPGCDLIVMTNSEGYEDIVAVYNEYTSDAVFDYDEEEEIISCLAPPQAIGEWPKD